jgi:trans-2,3-dihydro-3-hydroxyanthranilate isomerase
VPIKEYFTVDVFTTSHFGGNQLAVIPDATLLTATEMQQIASEFNYSEVTFVLPPTNPDHTARVRIFTPTDEIPFAGHPNVGTAFLLARLGSVFGRRLERTMIFEEMAGLVKAEAIYDGGVPIGATFDVPRGLEISHKIDPQIIADCASLTLCDLIFGVHPPTMASVGLPFALAQIASLEALARAKPNPVYFAEADERYPAIEGHFSLFLYVRVGTDPVRLRARMFAPLSNIIEDPATGSASGALGALLASLLPGSDVSDHVQIEQGVEMGRRSMIDVRTFKRNGVVDRVSISGACVPIMRGIIDF